MYRCWGKCPASLMQSTAPRERNLIMPRRTDTPREYPVRKLKKFALCNPVCADNVSRVAMKPSAVKGSDYINASFIDVS